LRLRNPEHWPNRFFVVPGHVAYVPDYSYNFVRRGVLDTVDAEVLPNRVLIFEEVFGKRFVDHSDIDRARRVVVRERPALYNFGPNGLKKSGHYARPACTSIFFG